MSLVAQMVIAQKYGVRLNMEQLAEVLGVARNTLYNQIAQKRCPIKTYVDGLRWADFRDVAAHLDECRERAR